MLSYHTGFTKTQRQTLSSTMRLIYKFSHTKNDHKVLYENYAHVLSLKVIP